MTSGPSDPFAVLGLEFGAPLEDIRSARRRLARSAHPDQGGSEEAMKSINAAFEAAVAHATGRRPIRPAAEPGASNVGQPPESARGRAPDTATAGASRRFGSRMTHDHPSFVVDALPAEAFEALLIVTSWIGEVLVDEPPYLLDVHLYEPAECWCRLELVPDAGGSTVSITVAGVGGAPVPDVEDVRDVWVVHLNQLGRWDG